MNIYTVNYILSRLSFAMAAALVIPLVLAIAGNEPSRQAFMLSSSVPSSVSASAAMEPPPTN